MVSYWGGGNHPTCASGFSSAGTAVSMPLWHQQGDERDTKVDAPNSGSTTDIQYAGRLLVNRCTMELVVPCEEENGMLKVWVEGVRLGRPRWPRDPMKAHSWRSLMGYALTKPLILGLKMCGKKEISVWTGHAGFRWLPRHWEPRKLPRTLAIRFEVYTGVDCV